MSLLASREQELADLDSKIAKLRDLAPEKAREIESLENALGPLESRKNSAVISASEARRRRGRGAAVNELEEKARWLNGAESGLRAMLAV